QTLLPLQYAFMLRLGVMLSEKALLVKQNQQHTDENGGIGYVEDGPKRHGLPTQDRHPVRHDAFPYVYIKHINHLPVKPGGDSAICGIVKPETIKRAVDQVADSAA